MKKNLKRIISNRLNKSAIKQFEEDILFFPNYLKVDMFIPSPITIPIRLNGNIYNVYR